MEIVIPISLWIVAVRTLRGLGLGCRGEHDGDKRNTSQRWAGQLNDWAHLTDWDSISALGGRTVLVFFNGDMDAVLRRVSGAG